MKRPIVLYGEEFDWDAGAEAQRHVTDADGTVNWAAAFAADPGCVSCPECGEWLWREGKWIQCPTCKAEFGIPTDEQQRQLNAARFMLREYVEKFGGVDNGYCRECGAHRHYGGPSQRKPGPCENPRCISHRVAGALDANVRREQMRAAIERLRQAREPEAAPEGETHG